MDSSGKGLDQPETSRLPTVSVLLVDDRPENLLALEASLEPLGQRLVLAGSGTAALRAVLQQQFAVILMDIRMPGLDGFETMALLKQREKSRDTPIIFLSAFPEQHHILHSYTAGAVDYILKPFEPEALRSKVSVFVTLRQNQLALEQAQARLEERVQERTAELAAVNQRLFDQAHHDRLTGLANRALFMEHLANAVARSKRRPDPTFAVMMIDVDKFKQINDTLGHLVGDALLAGIAHRLRECLREVDTAARTGGDEFTILLDGISDLKDATRTADRIQQTLARPFDLDGKEVFASASVGIAVMDARYQEGAELLRDADAAMYRAKEGGRARYQVFDTGMHSTVTTQLRLEADLARAVERDELVLEYQPIVRAADGTLEAFEALVRWHHPERGIIGPSEFIPIAEETGLIRGVGRWVLEQACQQLSSWRRDRPELAVSVNISTHQFAQPDLLDTIEAVLLSSQLPSGCLKLEIPESALMPRVQVAERTLARLRDLGVLISLEDFGAGYSSMNLLHELPISRVKLDRSLIERIGQPHDRPEIVQALVSLAHALGIDVTAKGVETQAQLDRVKAIGCDSAQGFGIARPLTVADATAFVHSANERPRARAG
jgi:diguanylate cyclase (GGDEF)-like protein